MEGRPRKTLATWSTRQDVETLKSYLKFPPAGTRAMASGYGNSDYLRCTDRKTYMAEQDSETTLVVHIETKLAYERAEEIVSTPGVDMVYVGPGDFSIEMGQPGDAEHPDVRGAMEEILELCKQYKIPFGTTAPNLKAAERWVSKGAQFFETTDERSFIIKGAKQLVDEYRKFTE